MEHIIQQLKDEFALYNSYTDQKSPHNAFTSFVRNDLSERK